MAQTGYTPISIYYSSTAAATPTSGNLVAGELAINTADGKLFYKDSAGVVQVIGTKGGVGSSTTTQVLYNSSGLVVGSANMTFNGTTFTLANDASISGLTVGKGLAGGATNTALGYTALSATTSGVENTGVGSGALQSVTTGSSNTAVGRLPLLVNTTGGSNTAIGTEALRSNTTASNNTAVGYQALYGNTTGNNNVAVGDLTLVANTTGANLVAIGHGVMYSSTGSSNAGVGAFALNANTTGASNTALGTSALQANTTASNNTAVGYQAGYSQTTATYNAYLGTQAGYNISGGAGYNVAIGDRAMYGAAASTAQESVAIGPQALTSVSTGNYNIAIGRESLKATTTGSSNVAMGYAALYANTTASYNTAVGYQAGYSNTTGTENVCIGQSAGYSNTTGSYSVYVGRIAGYSTTGIFNTFVGMASGETVTSGTRNTIIGRYSGNQGGLDIRTASNYIVLSDGDGNPAAYRGSGDSWTFGLGTATASGVVNLNGLNSSNSGPTLQGLAGGAVQWYAGSNSYIKGGTTYNTYTVMASSTGGVNLTAGATSWVSASDARLKNVTGKYETPLADIAQLEPVKFTWKSDEENKPQVGVLAQSVEKVVPEAIDTMRVDKKDETEYLGVRYTELIPLMIASIQELNAKLEAQALEIAALKVK